MLRRRFASLALALLVMSALLLGAALPAAASGGVVAGAGGPSRFAPAQRATLLRYAADTYRSMEAMVYPNGLPTDNINAVTRVRAGETSPTNIGAWIWSTISARDLGLITPHEAQRRIHVTLTTLSGMTRDHGFFFNWYSPSSAQQLFIWPETGATINQFLSSVDNGWLATALMIVERTVPQERALAARILAPMDFSFFRNPANGLLKGGFYPNPTPGTCAINGLDGFTCFDYGTFITEPRIVTYIGIARNQLPQSDYFRGWRTFPNTCDWSWQEMQPQGVTETYMGVSVFEGHYRYLGMNIVPSWGGSMFEALMPSLFVPEAQWGPYSWGVNHPLYVRAQIEHGLLDAKYGYWGFSPSSDPYVDGGNGYNAYGVDAIGMNPDGYPSDEDNTLVDYGYDSCPGRTTTSIPTTYGRGVVTPHASFLAMQFAPTAALANLASLRARFDAYGWGGFYDAVGVRDGSVSRRYLALDQGMIMPAISNALRGGDIQRYFSSGAVAQSVRPLMEMEHFTAGPAK